MGGCSYDRDVYGPSSGWGYSSSYTGSSVASATLNAVDLSKDMEPCDKKISSTSKHPIIIMLDVTGSNTNFARIVYDKMPMFYGQIEQKGYLKDFEISICAVGDMNSDDYPLQIADFSKGIEIDNWLKKLVLEGCGGGQRCETYEMAAYYLLKNFSFEKGSEPIIFFLGDEAPYDKIKGDFVKKYITSDFNTSDFNMSSEEVFQLLLKIVPNTYLFLNPYQGCVNDLNIVQTWRNMFKGFEKNIIQMQQGTENSIVDLMLGVIAMIGDRSLNDYKVDMLDRGQTQQRITSVSSALDNLSKSLVVSQNVSGLQKGQDIKRENRNTRL